MTEDHVQHGIDDDPNDDAAKGATIGGIGGAVVGAAAGAAAGPIGAVIGAVVGGVAGAAASGAAVAAIDHVDNDDTVSGVGHGHTTDLSDRYDVDDDDAAAASLTTGRPAGDYNTMSGYGATGTSYGTTGTTAGATAPYGTTGSTLGSTSTYGGTDVNAMPGIQTGGRDIDGTPDTRGLMEKTADAITGDNIDDKTGKPVDHTGYGSTLGSSTGYGTATGMGSTSGMGSATGGYGGTGGTLGTTGTDYGTTGSTLGTTGTGYGTTGTDPAPGIQTGGHAVDGTPDTRGLMEKTADAVTGDRFDDKTGKRVDLTQPAEDRKDARAVRTDGPCCRIRAWSAPAVLPGGGERRAARAGGSPRASGARPAPRCGAGTASRRAPRTPFPPARRRSRRRTA